MLEISRSRLRRSRYLPQTELAAGNARYWILEHFEIPVFFCLSFVNACCMKTSNFFTNSTSIHQNFLARAFGARGYVYHTVLGSSRKTNIRESVILADFDNDPWSP